MSVRHGALKKIADRETACSGNKICYSCKQERKKASRLFNKRIRRLNKKLTKDV